MGRSVSGDPFLGSGLAQDDGKQLMLIKVKI